MRLCCWLLAIPLAFAAVVVAGSITFSLNISVLDAAGGQLVGPAGEKPTIVVHVLNGTPLQCEDFSCKFYNVSLPSPGNATSAVVNVSVYWLGVIVYKGSVVAPNGTLVDLKVKVNASTVRFLCENDNGAPLGGCRLNVVGLAPQVKGFSVVSGQPVSLAFGEYNVTRATYERDGKLFEVPVLTPGLRVSNGTSVASVRLGVCSTFALEVKRMDGSPLAGAEVEVTYVDAGNVTIYKSDRSASTVYLSNVPYGRYLVVVRWRGEALANRLIEVSATRRNASIVVNLLPYVTLVAKDYDGQPVAGANLKVSRAAGAPFSVDVTTDQGGQAVLGDVAPGAYIVSFKWLNYTLNLPLRIEGSLVEVVLPLRRFRVRIGDEFACSRCLLPQGLSASLSCAGVLLANVATDRPLSEAVLEPNGPVYVGAPLKLRVVWDGRVLLERDVSAYNAVETVELPFFGLLLKVVDAAGKPLPGALLKIADELGIRNATSGIGGEAELEFLYGRRADVEVFWGGVPVAKEVVTPAEAVQIRANVYTLRVEVRGALGQPVANAQLEATVNSSGYSFRGSAATRDDGVAELKLPAPPGSRVVLEVSKGRASLSRELLTAELEQGVVSVTLDLVEVGPLQLRTGEVAGLVLAAAALTAAVFIALSVWGRRAGSRGLFEVYGGVEEAGEGEEAGTFRSRLLGRLKDVFGAEKEEEEEEEEGLFDEL